MNPDSIIDDLLRMIGTIGPYRDLADVRAAMPPKLRDLFFGAEHRRFVPKLYGGRIFIEALPWPRGDDGRYVAWIVDDGIPARIAMSQPTRTEREMETKVAFLVSRLWPRECLTSDVTTVSMKADEEPTSPKQSKTRGAAMTNQPTPPSHQQVYLAAVEEEGSEGRKLQAAIAGARTLQRELSKRLGEIAYIAFDLERTQLAQLRSSTYEDVTILEDDDPMQIHRRISDSAKVKRLAVELQQTLNRVMHDM